MSNSSFQPAKDPTRLGVVEDVSGASVHIKLAEGTETGLIFVRGEGYRIGQVGSFIRIPSGYTDLFGIVAQVGAGAAPETTDGEPNFGNRWLRAELIGEGGQGKKFNRGISQYPTIGDIAHVVTESDLSGIYSPDGIDTQVRLGKIASAESIPAYLDLNRLITRHSAIVGSTGSGKSTTVASLLNSLSVESEFPGTRILLLDLHGEYSTAFGDRAKVLKVNPSASGGADQLFVPFWALSSEEICNIATGVLNGPQLSYFLDSLTEMKTMSLPAGASPDLGNSVVTADTPLPFCIHSLWYDSHSRHYGTHPKNGDQAQSDENYAYETDEHDEAIVGDALGVNRPKFRPHKNTGGDADKILKSSREGIGKRPTDALEGKLTDPRLKFLFEPGPWAVSATGSTEKDLDSLLESWIGGDTPITVLDLSGIPSSILDPLVGAVLRILFDSLFWGRDVKAGARRRPLLVALEEAHTYLSPDSKGYASAAAKRFAKEGRKYGMGISLISQRPSEIDPTILSQCGTIISMRLTNERDRSQIKSCTSDNLDGLFSMLPILRTGEALVVGEAVGLPMRVLVTPPSEKRRPDSSDPFVVAPKGDDGEPITDGGWKANLDEENFGEVINCWRKQQASE